MSRLARTLWAFFDDDEVRSAPPLVVSVTAPGYVDVVTGDVVVVAVDVASTVSVAWAGAAVDAADLAGGLDPDDRRAIVLLLEV